MPYNPFYKNPSIQPGQADRQVPPSKCKLLIHIVSTLPRKTNVPKHTHSLSAVPCQFPKTSWMHIFARFSTFCCCYCWCDRVLHIWMAYGSKPATVCCCTASQRCETISGNQTTAFCVRLRGQRSVRWGKHFGDIEYVIAHDWTVITDRLPPAHQRSSASCGETPHLTRTCIDDDQSICYA